MGKKKKKEPGEAISVLTEMARKVAKARAARAPVPRKVRIHPLDLAKIPHVASDPAMGMNITRIVGIPVEPDCAVRRGHPVAEYETDDGA